MTGSGVQQSIATATANGKNQSYDKKQSYGKNQSYGKKQSYAKKALKQIVAGGCAGQV